MMPSDILRPNLDTLSSLPLDFITPALLGRQNFEHKIINKAPRVINDDVVSSKLN